MTLQPDRLPRNIFPLLLLLFGGMRLSFGSAAAPPDYRDLHADRAGRLYAIRGSRVFRIGAGGAETLVAGNGIREGAFKDGPAIRTALNRPVSMDFDGAGNLYLTDEGNGCVRKVTPDGMMTTVVTFDTLRKGASDAVRERLHAFSPGDAVVDSAGNLYVSDGGSGCVWKVTPAGRVTPFVGHVKDEPVSQEVRDRFVEGRSVPGPEAPSGEGGNLALDDAGNLYVNMRYAFYKVSPQGEVTPYRIEKGRLERGLELEMAPWMHSDVEIADLAADAAGDLFLSDVKEQRIYKLTPDGKISVAAETRTSRDGPWNIAFGLTVNKRGDLLYYGSNEQRIKTLARVAAPASLPKRFPGPNGATFERLARERIKASFLGTRPVGVITTAFEIGYVNGIAFDRQGSVYVSEGRESRILKISPNGTVTPFAGSGNIGNTGACGYSGDGGPATQAHLCSPMGIAFDLEGNLYIADNYNNCVRKVDTNGIIHTVAGKGFRGISKFSGDGGPATEAFLSWPSDVKFDSKGNLYVSDTRNHRIRVVRKDGTIHTVAGVGPREGFPEEGETQGAFSGDGGPATRAHLFLPQGLALDGHDNLYIADRVNLRVRRVDSRGVITTVAGNGIDVGLMQGSFSGDEGPAQKAGLAFPSAVVADVEGNLFIADTLNHRVRRVDGEGRITTVAGTGDAGYSGDGRSGTGAKLGEVTALALDARGNLLIADSTNAAVRKLWGIGSGRAKTAPP